MARAYTRHDWTKLDPLIARLQEEGYDEPAIAKELGIKSSTLRMHLKSRESEGTPQEHQDTPELLDRPEKTSELGESAHLSTPERTELTEVHQSIPEHQGTLEGYQEVLEDMQDSVPEMRQLVTEEEYPSTPEVHPAMSLDDSTMEHSSVPALRDEPISILPAHPSTPTAEDWELWTVIKARWLEVEKMLADRQALLSTPSGTPGHTQKKTYVFDVRHIAAVEPRASQGGRRGASFSREAESALTPLIGGARATPSRALEGTQQPRYADGRSPSEPCERSAYQPDRSVRSGPQT